MSLPVMVGGETFWHEAYLVECEWSAGLFEKGVGRLCGDGATGCALFARNEGAGRAGGASVGIWRVSFLLE